MDISSVGGCVAQLAGIDPMYQYSLQFYMGLFQGALRDSEKGEGQERIDAITYTFQRSLYTRVCRGLFAKDQLLFSFIMALKMFDCDPLEVRWLLLGGIDMDKGLTENPFDWLPDLNWRMVWRATRPRTPPRPAGGGGRATRPPAPGRRMRAGMRPRRPPRPS